MAALARADKLPQRVALVHISMAQLCKPVQHSENAKQGLEQLSECQNFMRVLALPDSCLMKLNEYLAWYVLYLQDLVQ